jgi:glutaconate CoA-transferase subunit A
MARFMTLSQAVADLVPDGCTLAMEGFTHLIPFAAGHELVRQKRRDLTLIRMTPDLLYDQLIGMGIARKLIFSWGGNPGVGSLHRFRDAVENGWPRPLEIEEHSHAAMANAYDTGAAGLPCAVFRGYFGSDLIQKNANIKFIRCPFTGEELACVPSLRPDVTIIHAQQADREGNVLIEGIVGVQKQAVLAARRALVTVSNQVETQSFSRAGPFQQSRLLRAGPNHPTRTVITRGIMLSTRPGIKSPAIEVAMRSGWKSI